MVMQIREYSDDEMKAIPPIVVDAANRHFRNPFHDIEGEEGRSLRYQWNLAHGWVEDPDKQDDLTDPLAAFEEILAARDLPWQEIRDEAGDLVIAFPKPARDESQWQDKVESLLAQQEDAMGDMLNAIPLKEREELGLAIKRRPRSEDPIPEFADQPDAVKKAIREGRNFNPWSLT